MLKALALAAVLPLVTAYPITADDVKCRAGPSTSDDIVTTFAEGHEVELECQIIGENIFGNSIWDKTTDGCYVSDYYVRTGSDGMVVDNCNGNGGGDSEYNGEITRAEIMARAEFWIAQGIPYSMEKTEPDINGRQYRTDCSGFVSMALHTNSPGYSTVSLPEVATPITYDEIVEGDFVGTLGSGTGGAGGHVVLFKSWTDDSKTAYNTLECKGGDGCVAWTREVDWAVGSFVSAPFRYTRVVD